jgi:hypothetical protein
VDNQSVIRMNQDTLYSVTVLDLSKPVKITLPEIGGRYMSMHVCQSGSLLLRGSETGDLRTDRRYCRHALFYT